MKAKFLAALFFGICVLGGTASAQNGGAFEENRPGLFNRLDVNNNGRIGRGDRRALRRRCDRDNNPPGRIGGRGTNWENPPGPRGGPGTSPNRRWRRR